MAKNDLQEVHEKIYDKWKNKAHRAINSGYKSAISHYTQQKNLFLKELNITGDEAIKGFIDELQNSIYEELNTDDSMLKEFDKGFDEIKAYIENGIIEKIETGNDYALMKLINGLNGRKPKQGEYLSYKTIKDELTKYLEEDFGNNRQDYLKIFNKATGFNTTDGAAANFIFGYARKIIYQKLRGDNNVGQVSDKIKHILKGYYRETAAVNALIKVVQKYNDKITAVQTGNVKDENNESIIYDILLGSVSNLMNKTDDELYSFTKLMENFDKMESDSINQELEFIGLGGQSKSWTAPWDTAAGKIPNLYHLEIAHKADIKPLEEDAYFWHAGVYQAMSNMINVIGLKQTLFFTGSKPYFTADLLAQFKAENYVLAFGMDKESISNKYKIIKSTIYFRLHEDK